MTHIANTITGTITAVVASQVTGALPWFEFRCECGEVARFSVEGMARGHAIGHANYMAKAGR